MTTRSFESAPTSETATSERTSHNERKTSPLPSHAIRRALAGVAVLTSALTLAGCSTQDNEPYTAYAEVGLPKIDDPHWHTSFTDTNGDKQLVQLNLAIVHPHTDNKKDYTTTFYDETYVPKPYKNALKATMNEPVVQLAMKSGAAKEYIVKIADADNGFFLPGDETVDFDISNGKGAYRLYGSKLGFVATGIHESTHALANDWYSADPGDTTYGEDLNTVYDTCDDMRDDVFKEFISENRNKLATAYKKTADDFRHSLKTGTMMDGTVISSIQGYDKKISDAADALYKTAVAVKANDPRIYDILNTPDDGYTCQFVDIFSIPYTFSNGRMGVYDEFSETQPIYKEVQAQTELTDEAYACIKDGNAVQDLTHSKTPNGGGHAYDNPTETVASMVTSVSINPTYVMECMNELAKTSPEHAEDLWKFMDAVWQVTLIDHPQLRDIMTKKPASRQVIEKMESFSQQHLG